MIAAVPQDLGAWASLVIPIGTLLVVGIQRITRLFDKVDNIAQEAGETKRIVKHHLGPNGDTVPIRDRLTKLEIANGVQPPPDA